MGVSKVMHGTLSYGGWVGDLSDVCVCVREGNTNAAAKHFTVWRWLRCGKREASINHDK